MDVTLTFHITRIGRDAYIATCNIGGVTVFGGRRKDEYEAAQSLFQVLGGNSGNADMAAIAVSVLVSGVDLPDTKLIEGSAKKS